MEIISKPKRVDLPFIEIPCRKNPTLKECYLLLYEKYMEYKIVGTYVGEREEGNGVPEELQLNDRWTELRSDILRVRMHRSGDDTWQVMIDTRQAGGAWDYPIDKGEEALSAYKQLKEYFISRANQ